MQMNDIYNKKLAKIHRKNEYLQEKYKLLSEQNTYKTRAKAPSTSKLILWTVVLICIEIVGFSEYAMLKTGDTSALYALVGVPATLVPAILGYYHKATKENCTGGITFETAVNGGSNDNIDGSDLAQEVNIDYDGT